VRNPVVVVSELPWSEMDDRSDLELIEAARSGIDAYAVLYRRYLDRVYRYVFSRTSSAHEAEDVTQEIFLRAYRALPRYEPRDVPFAAWLLRIARNCTIDASRRRRPSVSWEQIPESLLPVLEGDVPADAMLRDDLRLLRTLLADLPAEKRELLALRFAAGLTAAEIAAVVGKSQAAVEKALIRTLRALKEHYRDD
jgi:RNA polymerase sigma-70 factor, ECF subfamily